MHDIPHTSADEIVKLSTPQTKAEWDQYYHLRWQLLRKDWLQPVGSEQDELETNAFHIMAQTTNKLILGVGRIHQTSEESAQIRYMAVSKRNQRQGIGTLILQALEQHAKNQNVSKITLNARNDFIGFYIRMGYQAIGEGEVLFGQIHHTRMLKNI